MIDADYDIGELSSLVSSVIGRRVSLEQLHVRCTYPVFRGGDVFVKLGPMAEWVQTRALHERLKDCPYFAKLLVTEPVEYRGYAVFVTEWRESSIVFPEDFDSAQTASFVSGVTKLSEWLAPVRPVSSGIDPVLSPSALYDTVRGYVRRHPIAGRLLKALDGIPEVERTYGSHRVVTVHGDFHAKNFAFEGDRFSTVYDFDKLMPSLACCDLVNAMVERFSLLSMSASDRRRLVAVAREIFAAQPWPRDELVIMVNVLRLTFAARRIRKHPGSSWVAFDIWRRDLRIREILAALPES